MLNAFTGCCDRTPKFITSHKRKQQRQSTEENTEIVFPSITSFKAHPQIVNSLVIFNPNCDNDNQVAHTTEVPDKERCDRQDSSELREKSPSLTDDSIALVDFGRQNAVDKVPRPPSEELECTLATCSDTIKLFDLNDFSNLATLDNGHERDIKCLGGEF